MATIHKNEYGEVTGSRKRKTGRDGSGSPEKKKKANKDDNEEMLRSIVSDRKDDKNTHLSHIETTRIPRQEKDDEIDQLFSFGKKKKKSEKTEDEIGLLVEQIIAELEVAAEDDVELNRKSKPAVNKLKKLPLLTKALSKRQLQQEFLDHGVLSLLKNWLEPMPDGSLPSINIRAAILDILTEFSIDLEEYHRREQLKKAGLGKVIMFLSKSDEETARNRKMAKDIVDKWSRSLFQKSTRFEDLRADIQDECSRTPLLTLMPATKPPALKSRDCDLALAEFPKSSGCQSLASQPVPMPEVVSLDFIVRPQSKIDSNIVRARAHQLVLDQQRAKIYKKIQQLKASNRKQLQAVKLSVQGRQLVTSF